MAYIDAILYCLALVRVGNRSCVFPEAVAPSVVTWLPTEFSLLESKLRFKLESSFIPLAVS